MKHRNKRAGGFSLKGKPMSDKPQNIDGPAFPNITPDMLVPGGPGMTIRGYACIKLMIPETGEPELDAIIKKAQRNHFAGMALQAYLSNTRAMDQLAEAIEKGVKDTGKDQREVLHKILVKRACLLADAMLKESIPE